jgi:hypothetical protein
MPESKSFTPRLPRMRVGRKLGRTLYLQYNDEPSDGDKLIGMMDNEVLARMLVEAWNEHQQRQEDA